MELSKSNEIGEFYLSIFLRTSVLCGGTSWLEIELTMRTSWKIDMYIHIYYIYVYTREKRERADE